MELGEIKRKRKAKYNGDIRPFWRKTHYDCSRLNIRHCYILKALVYSEEEKKEDRSKGEHYTGKHVSHIQ
jgi:hypothetical protein